VHRAKKQGGKMIEGAEKRFKAILVSLIYIYVHIHLFPSIYNYDASSSADPIDFLRRAKRMPG